MLTETWEETKSVSETVSETKEQAGGERSCQQFWFIVS